MKIYQPELTEEVLQKIHSFEVYHDKKNAEIDFPDSKIIEHNLGDIENPVFVDENLKDLLPEDGVCPECEDVLMAGGLQFINSNYTDIDKKVIYSPDLENALDFCPVLVFCETCKKIYLDKRKQVAKLIEHWKPPFKKQDDSGIVLESQEQGNYKVELESEVFGIEEFEYGTFKEAIEGFERLKKSAKKQYKKDKIPRTVTLIDEDLIWNIGK